MEFLFFVDCDLHMSSKYVGILLADGGDSHIPRQNDVARGITVISIDEGVTFL